MHTLNIEAARRHAVDVVLNTPAPPSTGGGTSTPYSLNTPDILNSLISITSNPFFDSSTGGTPSNYNNVTEGDEDKKVFATLEPPVSGTNSPLNPIHPQILVVSPPPPPVSSVQSLTSQFIKDSLKLTIQTKRRCSGKEELDVHAEMQLQAKIRRKEEVVELTSPTSSSSISPISRYSNKIEKSTTFKLTPEDEERRRRRRERNKIAATKCRNKKKEKTGLLVIENQSLESTNIQLKTEISKLEEERQRLMGVLEAHAPLCVMSRSSNSTVKLEREPSTIIHHHSSTSLPIGNLMTYQSRDFNVIANHGGGGASQNPFFRFQSTGGGGTGRPDSHYHATTVQRS